MVFAVFLVRATLPEIMGLSLYTTLTLLLKALREVGFTAKAAAGIT